MCYGEWSVVGSSISGVNGSGVIVDTGYPVNHSMKGEFKFALPSAGSN